MGLPPAVILFGATGFIGQNIAKMLAGRTEVIPVSSRTDLSGLPPTPPSTIIINVAAFRYSAARFADQQPDIWSCNHMITTRLYLLALNRGITEIRSASSGAVYPPEWAAFDDEWPISYAAHSAVGYTPYARSKFWGEADAQHWHNQAGINTISFRLTNPYGPFDTMSETDAHVATAFVLRALRDEPTFRIYGDPTTKRDFVFAEDVAATFMASLELRGVHDAVNCAYGENTWLLELAIAAMRAAGNIRPVVGPEVAENAPRPRATTAKLRRLLPGLAPFRTLDEGMQQTVAWYRDRLSTAV